MEKNNLSDSIKEYKKQNLNYKLPVMLGLSTDGKFKFADLVDLKHILMVGQTGSGKSMFQDSSIYTLTTLVPNNIKLFLTDMKRVVLAIYGGIQPLFTDIIESPDDYFNQMDLLIKEKNRRLELKEDKNYPYIVVIIDTISDLAYYIEKKFEDQLSLLLDGATDAKIHVIISDSRINSVIFSPQILSLFTTKICFKTTVPEESEYIIGSDDGSKLNGNGDALLLSGRNELIRLQTPYISDEELVVLIENLRK